MAAYERGPSGSPKSIDTVEVCLLSANGGAKSYFWRIQGSYLLSRKETQYVITKKKSLQNQIKRKLDFEVCKLLAPRCNVEHFLHKSHYLDRRQKPWCGSSVTLCLSAQLNMFLEISRDVLTHQVQLWFKCFPSYTPPPPPPPPPLLSSWSTGAAECLAWGQEEGDI